jgi:hypothetical protein
MRLRGVLPVSAALVLAVLVAACGSGGSSSQVSAAKYMRSVCGAVGPWVRDVTLRANSLNFSPKSTPAQRKKETENYLDAVVADSQNAIAKLRAAGVPNIKDGKTVAGAIVGDFNQLATTMSRAAAQARSLPTNSAAAFNAAARALGTSISSSINSLNSLRNAQLERAAANEPACKQVSA